MNLPLPRKMFSNAMPGPLPGAVVGKATGTIANNFLIVPIMGTPMAEIPPDMWDLLKLGLGGYVLGRSAEKGVRAWKG